MAEGEAANFASLIAKSATLLIDARPTEHLHPRGTALVGGRRRDDPFRIEILRL